MNMHKHNILALLASLALACGGVSSDWQPAPAPAPSAVDGGDPSSDAGTSGDAGEAMCVPQTVECGKCGHKTGTCTDGGLAYGACEGEGACSAGATYSDQSQCLIRTCLSACRWDAWKLKPGAACATGTTQGCYGGVNCPSGVRRCVGCQWAAACTCN